MLPMNEATNLVVTSKEDIFIGSSSSRRREELPSTLPVDELALANRNAAVKPRHVF